MIEAESSFPFQCNKKNIDIVTYLGELESVWCHVLVWCTSMVVYMKSKFLEWIIIWNWYWRLSHNLLPISQQICTEYCCRDVWVDWYVIWMRNLDKPFFRWRNRSYLPLERHCLDKLEFNTRGCRIFRNLPGHPPWSNMPLSIDKFICWRSTRETQWWQFESSIVYVDQH